MSPVLQACPNGPRRRSDHPAVPVTPDECADAARAAVAAGARDLHLHPKDAEGRDSVRDEHVAPLLRAVRAAVPGTPVGVTTGAWARTDGRGAAEAVRRWTELPDHASVNWHEDHAEDVVLALVERQVAVDAGLWTLGDVDAWLDSPLRRHTSRVLLELPGRDDVLADAREMVEKVRPVLTDVLLHGEDRSAWPVLDLALELDLSTRIGLEDALRGPDGAPAVDTAQLVRAAVDRGRRD